MTSKLNINWLNKCRCGNRMHTVETVRGSHVRLFEDDAVKCNSCGREGVIQTCDGIATVLWETDAERAEGAAMTKSTITRERLQEIAEDGFLKHGESKELARMALAAMDSEPVAYMHHSGQVITREECCDDKTFAICCKVETPLYRHAQPAPVITFYRDGIEAAAKWIDQQREAYDSKHVWSDPDTGTFEFGNDAQRDYSSTLEELAEGIRALHPNAGNSPVIPDGYVMVPVEPNGDMLAAAQDAYGETDGDIASTLRAAIAAAQQEVK